jgi:hypothetical protein
MVEILPGLAAASQARASERPALNLVVSSQCPSAELIESELAPLLGEPARALDPSVTTEVVDSGDTYRIRVGSAERVVSDARRDCEERAKVSAVFIALNLPMRAPEPPPSPTRPRPSPPPALPAARSGPTQLALQLTGAVEHAPGSSGSGKGVYIGASLRRGPVELTLSSGVFAPLRVVAAEGEAVSYELWRIPSALTLGFNAKGRLLTFGVAAGLVLDLMRFQGVDIPDPDSGLRVNPGLLLALPLRLSASRHVAAVLMPTLSLFPRTYLVRLEPTRQLDETPRLWLGVRIGLELSVLGG